MSADFRQIFNREIYQVKGHATLFLDDDSLSTRFERYGSQNPGYELSRVFFTRFDSTGRRRAVLTITPYEFEIGIVADFSKEPIPACDRGGNQLV